MWFDLWLLKRNNNKKETQICLKIIKNRRKNIQKITNASNKIQPIYTHQTIIISFTLSLLLNWVVGEKEKKITNNSRKKKNKIKNAKYIQNQTGLLRRFKSTCLRIWSKQTIHRATDRHISGLIKTKQQVTCFTEHKNPEYIFFSSLVLFSLISCIGKGFIEIDLLLFFYGFPPHSLVFIHPQDEEATAAV